MRDDLPRYPMGFGRVQGPPRKGQGGICLLEGPGVPLVRFGIGGGGEGGCNANNGAGGLQSDRETSKRTKEGRTDIRNFEQASYKVKIAPLMLLRGQQRGGIDAGCP
jgi:hypothetical protein